MFPDRTMALSAMLRKCLLGFASIAGIVLVIPSAASAEVKVTGASPFSGCTQDNVAGQPGINFQEAEVEPWVDADPRNPSHLIAGWQQDRWSDGGSRSLMSGYSANGGATWTPVVVPGITLCAGGQFERASDPWVTISPDGTAYFMSLSFMNDEPSGAGGDNAMLVNRSTNGGASWGAPITLILDTDGQLFNDKNSMTADPHDSRFVYAVWDRLEDFTLPHGKKKVGVDAKVGGNTGGGNGADGPANARNRLKNIRSGATINKATIYTGPSLFVRTTNGGSSWEPAKKIFEPGSNAQTINNLIEVLPNGTVIDFFTHILNSGSVKLGMVKSNDKGAHFGALQHAFEMVVTNAGTVTPDAKEPVRDANILFDVAVDDDNGNIYAVWQDGRQGNIDRVAFSMSTNGGNSWSPAIVVNATPQSKNKLREQAFVPSVEVSADHKIVVTYYDFRNDTSDGRELTDFWSISCNPAAGANCRSKTAWGNETRLSSASFDMLEAPVARGHFLGDYMGMVKSAGGVTSVFGKSVGPNLNDMFARTIP